MPTAPVASGEIQYELHGEGTPLLLVAGLGGVGAYWRAQMEAYARHYRVVTYDHRGCGRSTRSKGLYTVDEMAGDLLSLMDHLEIEKAHLLGHSTGGAIGQTLAVTHPERLHSLTLSSSWTRVDAFMRRSMETRKTLLESAGVDAYIKATPLFLYPDWWINGFPERLAALDAATRASFPPIEIAAKRCQAVIDFDRVEELNRITAPTHVICAKDDFLTPFYFSEELARRIPGARLTALGRGGHVASQIEQEAFDRAVLDFLASVEKA
jgi:aminoacrylate hydrolase